MEAQLGQIVGRKESKAAKRVRRTELQKQKRQACRQIRQAAIKPPVAASIPETLDVAAIRWAIPEGSPAITQEQFAHRFGFSPAAVRDWEQGRRNPDGAARVLLFLIQHNSAGIEAAIQSAIGGSAVFDNDQNARSE